MTEPSTQDRFVFELRQFLARWQADLSIDTDDDSGEPYIEAYVQATDHSADASIYLGSFVNGEGLRCEPEGAT